MGRQYKLTVFVVLALVLFCVNAVARSRARSAESWIESLMREINDVIKREAQAAELMVEAENYYREGEKLFQIGEFEEARSCFQKAVRTASDNTGLKDHARLEEYHLDLLVRIRSLTSMGENAEKQGLSNRALAIAINDRVLRFMRYFLGPGRKKFEIGLRRRDRYKDTMEEIFAREGLPLGLSYVAQIESLYDQNALSRAGAKGIWQFMPDTGRRYGLTVSSRVDERSDPVKSTRAAARYLKDLYRMFGDWLLALASYNAGESRILEAVRRGGGVKDFWVLAERGLLPQETIDYVPAALAAITISNNLEMYGFAGARPERSSSGELFPGKVARSFNNQEHLSGPVKAILEAE